jgi:ABC-type branched-subunit amino acid transport system substrate-binding protein
VPINGSAGIWGPSSIACAQLAQAEINAAGGLLERQVRLRIVDSSDEALEVGRVTAELMHSGAIDAIVGMHTSQVRQRVLRDVARQIPYVYTPLYEGGERTPGVFALGETPGQQLRPALEYLIERYRATRWMAIGHDYVWPRVSHRLAARYLGARGAQLLGDRYLPFGTEDWAELLDEIRRLKPHAVLLSLVGQDAVHFNRAFGECGLSRDVFRLSCAIEENGLLAIGAGATEGLFVSSGYFASLDNDANMAFKERYHSHFGQRAPTLNALGQSTYVGVHFMAALARRAADDEAPLLGPLPEPLAFRSVRGTRYFGNERCSQPTYLAEAGGHFFRRPVAL